MLILDGAFAMSLLILAYSIFVFAYSIFFFDYSIMIFGYSIMKLAISIIFPPTSLSQSHYIALPPFPKILPS